MEFCSNCGKQLKDGAQFCPQCGKSVTPAVNQQQTYQTAEPSEQPKMQPTAELSGGEKILIVLLWPIGFYFYNEYKKDQFSKADQAITWMKWMVFITFLSYFIINLFADILLVSLS